MAAALLATLPSPTTTAATDLRPTDTPVHPHRHVWPTHSSARNKPTNTTLTLHRLVLHILPRPPPARLSLRRHHLHCQQRLRPLRPTRLSSTALPIQHHRHHQPPHRIPLGLPLGPRPPAPPHHPANTMVSPGRHSWFTHIRRVSMAPCVPWYS